MRFGSVCSGIEAASVAWEPLGWRAAFLSEIESFPRAVLQARWPGVPLHGDFTTIKESDYEPIELLVGGTPCQSFSVAGLRGGLDDERGNLALEYFRLAARLRPRWLVWENVPGVLSSGRGRDFGSILGALSELGYGWAYRILDAQYVRVDGFARAVPQRRRRVFVVGHIGGAWQRAAAVLFERESLSGHPAPRREAGEATAADVAPGLVASGRGVERIGETRGQDPVIAVSHDPAVTLTARERKGALPEADLSTIVAHTLRAEGFDAGEDGTGRRTPVAPVAMRESGQGYWVEDTVAGTIDANMGLSGHANRPATIAHPVAFDCKAGGNTSFSIGEIPGALRGEGHGGGHAAMAFVQNTRDEVRLMNGDGQIAGALAAEAGMKQQNYLAFSRKDHGADAGETAPTLRAMGHTGSHPNAGGHAAVAVADTLGVGANQTTGFETEVVADHWAVRRLTPRECERLQGFPDDYTLIEVRGKPAADGPRYKALGNSMAVNVMRWIGTRIDLVDRIETQFRQALNDLEATEP